MMMDGGCDIYSCKTCRIVIKSSSPSNQNPGFYRLDALPLDSRHHQSTACYNNDKLTYFDHKPPPLQPSSKSHKILQFPVVAIVRRSQKFSSYCGKRHTNKQTNKQPHRQDRLQYTALLSLASSVKIGLKYFCDCVTLIIRISTKIEWFAASEMLAKYSRLFNLGEMSCFNQHNAVQWIWIPFCLQT